MEDGRAGTGTLRGDFVGVVGLGEGGDEGVQECRGGVLGGDGVEKSLTHRSTCRGPVIRQTQHEVLE